MTAYTQAQTVGEAVAAMAGGARPVAGGTDLVVGARQGKQPLPESLVGIHRIEGLDGIVTDRGGLRLGALVTHGSIVAHPDIRARFTGLADASAIVGSHATRANGTIGGNIMNASPAMDTGAPLLCLDAAVSFSGPGGDREIGLADLWTGPGTHSAAPDELLVSVRLPDPGEGFGSSYVRLQYRRQMEIAVVGVGVTVQMDGPQVSGARIAIAALAPTIHRMSEAEEALVGSSIDQIDAAARLVAAATRPISDVRASADYRRAMAEVIAARAIRVAIKRAMGETVAIPASDSTFGS